MNLHSETVGYLLIIFTICFSQFQYGSAVPDSSHFDCAAAGGNPTGISKHQFPTNCENWVYCVKNKPFLQKCPPLTAYNPATKECEVFETVSGCANDDPSGKWQTTYYNFIAS